MFSAETTLYDTTAVDTCYYTVVQTYRLYTAKSEH